MDGGGGGMTCAGHAAEQEDSMIADPVHLCLRVLESSRSCDRDERVSACLSGYQEVALRLRAKERERGSASECEILRNTYSDSATSTADAGVTRSAVTVCVCVRLCRCTDMIS